MSFLKLSACVHVAWREKPRPNRKKTNVNDENEWKCSVGVMM